MSLLPSHFLVPPPPPLSSPLPLTLGTLDDDSLLLLFSTLALPHLLTLRGVSRRFAYLIQRYTLPQWRTLLYGYSEAESNQRGRLASTSFTGQPQVVDLFFSRTVHPYTDFCHSFGEFGAWDMWTPSHEPFYRQPRPVHRTLLRSLPATLPRLLPNLSSLTFTQFRGDDTEMTQEQLTVNCLLTGYLQSSWSGTLVSLHLYLEVVWYLTPGDSLRPFPLEGTLSQLTALRHLQLQLSPYTSYDFKDLPLLPDSLPVLGQLTSFGLHHYSGSNVPLLLRQLGPNLVTLTLNNVTCSVADFAAFLRAKPNYRRTLRVLEIELKGSFPPSREFYVTCQCLPSLERFNMNHFFPEGSLYRRLFSLSRLLRLRELTTLWMSLHQLRALRDNSPHQKDLPQLPSIRTLHCRIENWADWENQIPLVDAFPPDELFHTFLPLLANTFTHLQHLQIHCSTDNGSGELINDKLSQELTAKVKECFPHLLSCKATYAAQLVIG